MKQEMFEFLDALRDSGACNMFGSGMYLQEVFGLDRYEAKEVVLEWMSTFSERKENGQISA